MSDSFTQECFSILCFVTLAKYLLDVLGKWINIHYLYEGVGLFRIKNDILRDENYLHFLSIDTAQFLRKSLLILLHKFFFSYRFGPQYEAMFRIT